MHKKIVFFLIILCSLLSACSTMPDNGQKAAPQMYSSQFYAMDTVIDLYVYAESEQLADTALHVGEQEFLRVERLLTAHEEDLLDSSYSEVLFVNAAQGAKTAVGEELFDLIRRSLSIAEVSEGAFDVAMGELIDLWNIKGGGYLPTGDELQNALAKCGNAKLSIDEAEQSIALADGVRLDLGGVAKGYAVDCAAAVMKDCGISSALINAGGNVLAIGVKPDGSAWQVGVRKPDGSGEVLGIISLIDKAAVTSAVDQRFFIAADGKKYHHILDPHSGYPADKCLSVTIVCASSTTADLLSTAVFVLGEQGAARCWEALPSFDMLMLDNSWELVVSVGMQDILTLNP